MSATRAKVKVAPPPIPTAAMPCSCEGCREHPWPDCAGCGAPAVLALTDHLFAHSMPLCRACLLVVLESRYGPKHHGRPPKAETAQSMTYDAIISRRRRARKTAEKQAAWAEQRALVMA